MKLKTFTILFIAALMVTAASCIKNPVDNDCGDYLKFSNAHVHIANKQGARGAVMISSNITWQLSIEAPVPTWMVLDKFAGTNSDSLVVTATQDNTTGGYKFANVIATPVNNSTVMPVRLTIVQYDSTYKGNR